MFQRIPAIDTIEAATGWTPTTDLDGILSDVIEQASARRRARVGTG